jgi:hypothetical protein
MSNPHLSAESRGILRQDTGVVIPLYLPANSQRAAAETLVSDTVEAFVEIVDDPQHICISVDGKAGGADTAAKLARQFSTSLVVAPENRGKLQGAVNGLRELSAHGNLSWFAVVDQDGDHFANELANLLRAGLHITRTAASDRVLVIGRRASRHRPMGWLRGELEELADRVLLDALHYHATTSGRPLCLEFSAALEEFPDFHSGYKLFSRATADAVATAVPQPLDLPDSCYYQHAVEAVLVVEAILAGALIGAVNRSTFDEQPVSVFGQFNREQLIADKIIWPCRRLGVPTEFVMQWMANHAARLLLGTLLPDGRNELLSIRRLVAEAFGTQPDNPVRSLFV